MSSFFENVLFWSDRFREHALFLYMLLDERKVPNLKYETYRQYQQWDMFLSQPANDPFQQKLPQMLDELLQFKQEVLAQSDNNINVILPVADFKTLVAHMIEELQYFINVSTDRLTPEDELNFWIREITEHTELISRSLPPGPLQNQVNQTVQALKTVKRDNILSVVQQANQAAVQLERMIRNGQVQSLINPMMLEHEIKEAKRGEQRIRQLLGQ